MSGKVKTKVKKMKLALDLTQSERERLIDVLRGACDCVVLEDVCLAEFEIEGVKSDCIKDVCLDLKYAKVKCLKFEAFDLDD